MKKLFILTVMFCLCLTGCSNPKQTYESAVNAMKKENWEEASKLFDSISDYEDSKKLSNQCKEEKLKHEKADYKFLEDMAIAIMKRYEISQKENSTLLECVEYDMTALGKYKEAEFHDAELQKLALQYIEGVEIQKLSESEELGNRQLKDYEGKVKRFIALKDMTDKYGLLKDNVDYQVNYYNVVENLIAEYEAFKEIEESLKDFIKDPQIIDQNHERVIYKNTTNHNFELYVYFTFMNEAGEVIKNTEEYYQIEAQSTNQIDFYVPDDTYGLKYYTEEYIYH